MTVKLEHNSLSDLFEDIQSSGIISRESRTIIEDCDRLHADEVKQKILTYKQVYHIMNLQSIRGMKSGEIEWKIEYRDIRQTHEEHALNTTYFQLWENITEDDYQYEETKELTDLLNKQLSL